MISSLDAHLFYKTNKETTKKKLTLISISLWKTKQFSALFGKVALFFRKLNSPQYFSWRSSCKITITHLSLLIPHKIQRSFWGHLYYIKHVLIGQLFFVHFISSPQFHALFFLNCMRGRKTLRHIVNHINNFRINNTLVKYGFYVLHYHAKCLHSSVFLVVVCLGLFVCLFLH